MADRATLHFNKLDDFSAFMAQRGWSRAETKGDYEVLRLTKPGEVPLIFYTKLGAKEHATIQGPQLRHVRRYLRERGRV